MTTLTYNSTLKGICIAFILLISQLTFGRDVEKTRTINKSYTVDNSIRLAIENQFGKVHVNTWDKNQIEVSITIKVVRGSEKAAEEILEKIDIEIKEEQSKNKLISFKTKYPKIINNKKGEEVRVDYTINMPKQNPLKLINGFGDVYLADINSDLILEVSYGNLVAKNLEGLSKVKVEFGKGEIALLAAGNMKVSYSKASVENVGTVEFDNQFSDINIGKSDKVTMDSKYGKVIIKEVNTLKADVEFSGFNIDKVHKSVVAKLSYPNNAQINWISKKADLVDVSTSFGSIDLSFENGAGGDVELKSSFGSISTSGSFDFNYTKKGDFDSIQTGKFGSGGSTKVKVSSSYGKIKVGFVN